jgi:hypothetical protein
MAMKNQVTVMVEDKWIAVDDETIEFENGFKLIPEHENLWALHWKDGKGEYQFDDPPENYLFGPEHYYKYVDPYVRQWQEEKIRQDYAAEVEWNKPENVEARARAQRNMLLAETDYMLMPDYPLTDEQREAWTAYRQALRNLPEQEGWPFEITWPVKPEA